MEDVNQVTESDDSSVEETALPQADAGTIGAPEASPVAVQDGTAAAETPEVTPDQSQIEQLQRQIAELNGALSQRTSAYDRQYAERRRAESHLAELQQREQQRLQAITQDADQWFALISDPVKFQQYQLDVIRANTQAAAAELRAEFEGREAAAESQRESLEAGSQVDAFRRKAGIPDAEYTAFLQEFMAPAPDGTMKPFGNLSPRQAAKTAQEILTGRYATRLAGKMTTIATKNAETLAAAKRKQQLPSPGTVATPGEIADTQAQEEWLTSMLKETGT